MARAKQKSDLLNFTIFHNEFIETEILSGHEKLVFMAIKRHLNEKTNKSFPSLSTISRYSRLCKSTVQKTLKSLEDKGIIQVEHRQDSKNNGNKSNEYTLYDYKSMWTAANKEEMKQAIEQGQEVETLESLPTENLQKKLKEIQRILERRSKEKGLVSDSDQTADTSTQNYNSSKENHTINNPESQECCSTSKADADALLDRLWMLYPVKKGKGKISDTQKKKLLKIGYDEMARAIERYKRYVESVDYLHYQNGGTFFNGGYVDYLDANYDPKSEPEAKSNQKKNMFNDYPHREYDFDAIKKGMFKQ